jgi:hypothetical protein
MRKQGKKAAFGKLLSLRSQSADIGEMSGSHSKALEHGPGLNTYGLMVLYNPPEGTEVTVE